MEMAPKGMSLTYNPEAKAAPPVETWMMPSLLLSARPLQHGIGRCQGRDIDGGVGELLFECMVDHLAIGFVICYWHVFFSSSVAFFNRGRLTSHGPPGGATGVYFSASVSISDERLH